jgi:hypothetical protein
MEKNLNKELQKYVNGDINYIPLLNIFTVSYSKKNNKDLYAELGKYIFDSFDGNLPDKLKYHENLLKGKKIAKFSAFDAEDNKKQIYSSVAIYFLAEVVDADVLKKLFGEPIYHNEFGEGFEDYENSEAYSFASYFVELEGVRFHIGYDNRGTTIEAEEDNSSVEKVTKSVEKLIDMCKSVL